MVVVGGNVVVVVVVGGTVVVVVVVGATVVVVVGAPVVVVVGATVVVSSSAQPSSLSSAQPSSLSSAQPSSLSCRNGLGQLDPQEGLVRCDCGVVRRGTDFAVRVIDETVEGASAGPLGERQLNSDCGLSPLNGVNAKFAFVERKVAVPVSSESTGEGELPRSQCSVGLQPDAVGATPSHCSTYTSEFGA